MKPPLTPDSPPSCVDPENIAYMIGLAKDAPEGCFVEFGVFKGGTAWHLAKVAREKKAPLYLYDTFSGMPFQDAGDEFEKGSFSSTSVEEIKGLIPDAILCPGVFPASLATMPPIAFCHLDCDQYQSYKDAWRVLSPLMAKGGVMVMDDYPVISAAKRAVDEDCGDRVSIELGKGVVRF